MDVCIVCIDTDIKMDTKEKSSGLICLRIVFCVALYQLIS